MTDADSLGPAPHLWQVGLATESRGSLWLVMPAAGLDVTTIGCPVPPDGIRAAPAAWTHVTLGPGPAPQDLDACGLPESFSVPVLGVEPTAYSTRVVLGPSPNLDVLRQAFSTRSVHESQAYYATLAYAVESVPLSAVSEWLRSVDDYLPPSVHLSRVEERRTGDLGPFGHAVLQQWPLQRTAHRVDSNPRPPDPESGALAN